MSKVGKRGSGNQRGTGASDILSDDGVAARLEGHRGDDLYLISSPDTVVVEKENGGIDEVRTALDWRLGAWVENLTLTGDTDASGTGNALDNVILGNVGANELAGGGGNDTLDGDAGDDTLDGGDGDDLLLGGEGHDVAVFSGLVADYEIRREGDEIWVIRGAERDVLYGVEILRFVDADLDAGLIGSGPPPPDAVEDTANGTEDRDLMVRVLDNDLGDGLRISAASNGEKGTVVVNADGTITYTPLANATGPDAFSYTVVDGSGRSDTALVSVELAAVNDAPVALDDSYSIAVGGALSVNVLANDADIDGDPLSVIGFDAMSDRGASVEITADGRLSYTAPPGFSGPDRFSYTVSDGAGATATAAVQVSVVPDDTPPDDDLPYYVEALIYGVSSRWNAAEPLGSAVTLTYSFLQQIPDYYAADAPERRDFAPFNDLQVAAATAALRQIEALTDIVFVEAAPDEATIVFGTADLNSGSAWAYSPSPSTLVGRGGDVWLDNRIDENMEPLPGTDGYSRIFHEIGHALGLKHPHEEPSLPEAENSRQYTVMSYVDHAGVWGVEPTTYMSYDIAALQYLYGSDTTSALGDTVYSFGDVDGVVRTIWDAGGLDTLDATAATQGVTLDLREGSFSSVGTVYGAIEARDNVAVAYGTVLENAAGGSGDDVLIGNAVGNVLNSGAGNDTMTGGAGRDHFRFDAGWGTDVITDFSGGEDRIDLSATGLSRSDLSFETTGGDQLVRAGDDLIILRGLAGVQLAEADVMLA